VEKVVEKVKYVAADLYAKVRVSYEHVLNVVKPSAVVMAKTVLSISTSAKEVLRPIYIPIAIPLRIAIAMSKPRTIVKFSFSTIASGVLKIFSRYAPPHLLAKLAYAIVKPTLPAVRRTSFSTIASGVLKIFSMYVRPHIHIRPSFSLISRPSKPLVTLISSSLALSIGRSVVDVKKPFPSFRLVVRPAKPSPSVVASNNPSVGVRKSP